MTVSFTIFGRDIVNNLFESYNLQDTSRKDPSPRTVYPARNSLLQNTIHPPKTIFKQSLERTRKMYNRSFNEKVKSRKGYSIYNRSGKEFPMRKFSLPTLKTALSIIVGEDEQLVSGSSFLFVENEEETNLGANVDFLIPLGDDMSGLLSKGIVDSFSLDGTESAEGESSAVSADGGEASASN